MRRKYIFVTGGVLSSLGKGLSAAALGALLEARGLKVTNVKMDPYINVDPGTMSPYQHGEVFEKFARGKDGSGRYQGVGLGLALVRHFVELHGGSVAITSTPNEGTEVTCRVPVAGAAEPSDRAAAALAARAEPSAHADLARTA